MMSEEQQKLVESNMKLVYTYVHKYGYKFRHDIEDSIQIASVGLCKAAVNYDASKGFAFSTYAYKCMQNEFLMLTRKQLDAPLVSLDEIVQNDDIECKLMDIIPDTRNVEEDVICKDQIQYAINKLTGKYQDIVKYLISNPGTSGRDCASIFKVSQPTVSRAINRFKQLYFMN